MDNIDLRASVLKEIDQKRRIGIIYPDLTGFKLTHEALTLYKKGEKPRRIKLGDYWIQIDMQVN